MGFIRFIEEVKSQYKQDLHCSNYKEKTATQLRRRVLQEFILPIQILFQDLSSFGPSKQYPNANRPEYKERSSNLRPCQQPCYSFSPGFRRNGNE